MSDKRQRVIIALAGQKGCGKSTVAEHLVRKHGFRRISHASPGREMLKALGLRDVDFSPQNKETPIEWMSEIREVSPRYLMQTLLHEWGREHVHPDIWAMVVARKIENCQENIVIDDLRYDNEAQLLLNKFGRLEKKLGGGMAENKDVVKIIQLLRPGFAITA
jgi:hypothetical protein